MGVIRTMYVFLETTAAKPAHRMYVTPASDSEASQWRNDDGTPKQFCVEFRYGKAEVDNTLGRFMVDHGMCKETSLLLPRRPAIVMPNGGAVA